FFQPCQLIFSIMSRRLPRRVHGSTLHRKSSWVSLYFLDCRDDLVHVLLVAQQRRLRDPNRFPCGAPGIGKRILKESVLLLAGGLAQALAIFAIAKHM